MSFRQKFVDCLTANPFCLFVLIFIYFLYRRELHFRFRFFFHHSCGDNSNRSACLECHSYKSNYFPNSSVAFPTSTGPRSEPRRRVRSTETLSYFKHEFLNSMPFSVFGFRPRRQNNIGNKTNEDVVNTVCGII